MKAFFVEAEDIIEPLQRTEKEGLIEREGITTLDSKERVNPSHISSQNPKRREQERRYNADQVSQKRIERRRFCFIKVKYPISSENNGWIACTLPSTSIHRFRSEKNGCFIIAFLSGKKEKLL